MSEVIIGASSLAQLEGNIAAAELRLTPEQMTRLDKASAPAKGFSAGLADPSIRRMVFVGQEVSGWGKRS